MKKILIIILIILLCTSCKDYTEINDLTIVTGMIIDYKDNMYEITTELILNDTKKKVKTITTKGETIEKCLAEASSISNKEIFITHLKVLIITDNILKNNINFYDYFLRNSKSKMNFNIFLVNSNNTKDIFNLDINDNGVSLYLEEIMKYNTKDYSSSIYLPFIDLVYKNINKGIKPIFQSISIKDNNIYLENAEFITNNKEVILNKQNIINYNILTNNIERTVIDLKCDNNIFSIIINNSKTKYKYKNNTFYINTNINAIINDYECSYDLDNINTIKKLNTLANNQIKDNINDVINISKEYNYDFIGIGNYIYKHNTKEYKNNYNLNDIKTEININVKINSVGEKRK